MPKGICHNYTPEQHQFLVDHKEIPRKELAHLFNKTFKSEVTVNGIKGYCKRHNIMTGRNGRFPKGHQPFNTGTKGVMKANSGTFKKGNRPQNYRPVGSERINADGYIEIKVADPATWRLKQQVVWEQHHGKIPKNHIIRFKDFDRANPNIDNLFMVTLRENAILNKRYKLGNHDIEFRDTLILLGRIDAKTSTLERINGE